MSVIGTIKGHEIILNNDGSIQFDAGANIDGDGSPKCYGPNNIGLDFTANGGHPGNWWGVVTDNEGNPIIQGSNDPAPGYYVSTTSFQNIQFPLTDPRRYLDSSTVPFFVVPAVIINSVKPKVIGSKAQITYNGKTIDAIVGDSGPADSLGELSIAAALALGIPSSPKNGGVDSGVNYILWPGEIAVVNTIDGNIEPPTEPITQTPIPVVVSQNKITFLNSIWKWFENKI